MKRNSWMVKILGLAMVSVLLVSSTALAAPVYNTQPDMDALEHPDHDYEFEHAATKYVIDTDHRGVLHIHKADAQREDLGDVTYTIYQVAEIVQGQLDGSGTRVSMEYQSLIKDSTGEKNPIAIPSGLNRAAVLQQWVNDLRDSEDPAKRMGNLDELPSWSGTTDINGNVTFDGDGEGLPLGVYIVYESSYPGQIVEAQPFVVSIPTTSVDDGNNDAEWPGESDDLAGDNMQGSAENAGIYWVYDVQAHPKNATKSLAVEKHIIADSGAKTEAEKENGVDDPANDVLTDTEDYEIGDTIRYWMKADVPATIGELEVYYLLDRMSVGQTFTNDVAEDNKMARMEVWGKTLKGEMVYIPRYSGDVENYRVVSENERENITNTRDYTDFYGNSMTIRDQQQPKAYAHETAFAVLFNTQSLSIDAAGDGTTKRVPLYSEVYVTYNLVLNEKALVGRPGNVNDVALVLSHRTIDNRIDIENKVHVPEKDIFDAFEEPEKLDLDVINPQCIDTRVYTYAVQLTKVGEGTENMEGVTFELCDERGNPIKVSQYTEEDRASLEVDDCTGRIGDYYVDPDAAKGATITIDRDQEIYIYGLGSGMYQLVETKTLNEYQLLQKPIVLTITSDSSDEMKPMSYCTDPEGDYFQIQSGKGYYIWQDDMKLKIDVSGHEVGSYVAVSGEVYSYETKGDDGSMSQSEAPVKTRYSYRYTDSESMDYRSNYGMEKAVSRKTANGIFDSNRGMYEDGLFAFTVMNRHGFNIPSTGGVGTMVYAAVGSGVAGVGLTGMLRLMKRRKDGDEK